MSSIGYVANGVEIEDDIGRFRQRKLEFEGRRRSPGSPDRTAAAAAPEPASARLDAGGR